MSEDLRKSNDSLTHLARIVSAISIHSYGNVLIFPWGYSMEKHPDKDRLSRLAYKMMNNVKWYSEDYEIYVPGTAFEVQNYLSMKGNYSEVFRCLIGGGTPGAPRMTGTAPSASATASPGSFRRRTKTASTASSSHLQI